MPEVNEVKVTGEGVAEYKGVEYTESTTFCEIDGCDYNKVIITVTEAEGTSVDNIGASNRVNVYPNPSGDVVKVESLNGVAKLELCNLLGELLEVKVDDNSLSVASYPQGTYLLRVYEEGGDVIVCKVVVKR